MAYIENNTESWGASGKGMFVLRYSYLIARETNDQFQVSVLHTTDYRINDCLQGRTISMF